MTDHAGDLLSALLDGELEGDQVSFVRAHVTDCDECARELDDVRFARRLLRELPAVDPPADLAPDAVVVPLGRRRGGPRVLAAAAAILAVAATGAVLLARPAGDAVEPGVEVAIEKHASTVGALEADGVLDESTERLEAADPAPPTTAAVQPLSTLDDGLWAPQLLAGYELVEAYRSDDGVHLLYRRGVYGLSVIERRGELDPDGLPERATQIRLGGAEAWLSDDGRVLVLVLDGVVVTVLADEPGDAAVAAAAALLRDR